MNWVTDFLPTLWISKKRKHDKLEKIKISRKEYNDLINDQKVLVEENQNIRKQNRRRKRNYNNTITKKNKTITNLEKQLEKSNKDKATIKVQLDRANKKLEEIDEQCNERCSNIRSAYVEQIEINEKLQKELKELKELRQTNENHDSDDSLADFLVDNSEEIISEPEREDDILTRADLESADSSSSTDDDKSDYSEREIDRPNGQSLNPIIQINELTELNQNFVENILRKKYRSLQGIYIWVENDIIKFGMVYTGDNPIYIRLKAEFNNLAILFKKKPKLHFLSTANFDSNNTQSNKSKTLAFKAETNLKTLLRELNIKTNTLTNRLGEYIDIDDIEIDLLVDLAQKAWEKAVNEYDELEGDEFTPGDEH